MKDESARKDLILVKRYGANALLEKRKQNSNRPVATRNDSSCAVKPQHKRNLPPAIQR